MAETAKTRTTADILSPEQIETLKQELLTKQRHILALYSHDMRAGQESTQEGTDDLVDRANNAYNRELMFSLSDAERQQLIQVDEALRRFDDGTYGFCQHSGDPIDYQRLLAVPWARYRIEYQELAEKGLLDEDGA